jgi:hypothetical protein
MNKKKHQLILFALTVKMFALEAETTVKMFALACG